MIPLDDARIRTAESVFNALMDLPAAQRDAALNAHCGSDLALRTFIQQLLLCDAGGGRDVLDRLRYRPPADAPRHVGRYRIVGRIGEGGMGVVYEAVQESPQRRVAVKLIRQGLTSGESLRRFRREAEMLGQLEHPGIARIYEAGAADVDGPGWRQAQQPFLAMELVCGEPLGVYAQRTALSVGARLALLARLCDIVQYAHQKGVIHRDLKPANILVDPDGQPRVLDFGVARAARADSDLTRTADTAAGQLVGTLAYMSPEQLAGDPSAVDTRSDIYALGVIAYELLCGQLPLSVGGQPLPQMIRTLSENEPRRAGSIQRDLAGDIEAILSRALEKSPSRRYATAAEFAADIRRHLRHEPVLARSPSTLYQFRKFARRNRTLVTAGALTLAALVAGLAGTATFAWREREQAEHTRVEAARAQAVIQFLREMLAAVDPQAVRGRDVTVRQVLDAAAERIQSGELAGQPEVEAALRSTIGETYLGLGLYANARPHLETALSILRERHGVQHADTISNLNLLGRSLDGLAEFAESERLHREALDAQRQLHGGDSLHAAPLLADLGDCLLRQGELEEAETCQREALALRETKPGATPLEIAESLDRLGAVLFERGKPADAEPLFRRALEIRRAGLPPDHPDLAHVLNQLGFVLYRLEIWNEAESMLREALDIYRRTIDPRHPDLALCLNNLAMLMKRGQSPDAIPLLREAIDIQTHVLGPTHPEVGESLVNLGHALGAIGQFDEADRVTQRALEIQRQAFGPRHQDYAFALHNVAVARTQRGDPAGAEPLLREALSILEERLGPDHTYTSHMCDSLGVTLTRLERYAEAMSYIERALEQRQSTFADGHGHIAISRANRSLLRLRIGDAAGAVEDALAAIPPLRAHGGTPAHLATALLVLAEARIAQKSPFDATELHSAIDEAATLRREQYGARSWQFSDAERVRGLLLMHTGHYADADAVLREALTALDTQPATSDPEIHHTRRRIGRALATLHEDWHIRTAPVPGRRGSVNP